MLQVQQAELWLSDSATDKFQAQSTILELIQTCAKRKDLSRARKIHADLIQTEIFPHDILLCNALLGLYVKCGDIDEIEVFFSKTPLRNIVSWNSLIGGYARNGHYKKSSQCLKQMQDEGFSPNVVTFICALKACDSTQRVEEIHVEVSKRGLLEKSIPLGNALIDSYAKCGVIGKAKKVFDELLIRDVVTWNTLITGYAQHGHAHEALDGFVQMRDEGFSPDAITFVCALKACGKIGCLEMGKEIHAMINKSEGLLEQNVILANALVDMYAKCNMLEKAQEVFDKLCARDVTSWNALISGHLQHGRSEGALKCFKKMQDEGISPNAITFVCALNACGTVCCLRMGEEIYAKVFKLGLLNENIVVGNALVDMYVKCSMLKKAQEVFDFLLGRNISSWNTLITGYAQHGLIDEAVSCFKQMQGEGISPDTITFICILQAFSIMGSLELGEKEIVIKIHEKWLLEKDGVLGTAMVDMYTKCCMMNKAREIFDELPVKNVASWSALIAGYAENGLGKEALDCFMQMKKECLSPDAVTFVCILKACCNIESVEIGQQIHNEVEKQGFLEENVVLGNAIIDMYSKCNMLEKARQVFDALPKHDITSWNILITGYVQHGLNEKAIECFLCMQDEGLSPNVITFLCIAKACSNIGSLEMGEELYAKLRKQGMAEKDIVLRTALVDMYSNCGVLGRAHEIFDDTPIHNISLWTALMSGYAQVGKVERVFSLFNTMIKEEVSPDMVSFVVLLNACSHVGLVEAGKIAFNAMSTFYFITPTMEHYTCMVDLFARAGHFDKALGVIEKGGCSHHVPCWLSLLAACYKWEISELGRMVFERLVSLDDRCSAAYVCMRNISIASAMYVEG